MAGLTKAQLLKQLESFDDDEPVLVVLHEEPSEDEQEYEAGAVLEITEVVFDPTIGCYLEAGPR